jgi:murein L,D-transpeptidase YcbB/YkuD
MRLATMEANLRRLQQQSRDWGDTYVAVNIAAARYRLIRDGETVVEQVAIVGQPDWKTPEIDSQIERIELNPYWTVPTRIALLEVGPEIEKDPDYLAKHNMRKVGDFYRQDPGPGNALGKAKFLFPNGYDVYLHDTNSPRLFEREVRFLSHGCVRVPNAVELAEHLLQDDSNWTRERIDATIGRGKNRSIELATPVPVHLVYDTAWVDESGEVQFRKDIYGRDADLLVAAAK